MAHSTFSIVMVDLDYDTFFSEIFLISTLAAWPVLLCVIYSVSARHKRLFPLLF
jgi:hypothetical protein